MLRPSATSGTGRRPAATAWRDRHGRQPPMGATEHVDQVPGPRSLPDAKARTGWTPVVPAAVITAEDIAGEAQAPRRDEAWPRLKGSSRVTPAGSPQARGRGATTPAGSVSPAARSHGADEETRPRRRQHRRDPIDESDLNAIPMTRLGRPSVGRMGIADLLVRCAIAILNAARGA
jgi:hypothetical protein